MGFFDFLTEEIAIDLGTANTLIIHNDKVVIDSPSIVARDRVSGKIIAVGKEANLMQGKTHENIKTIRPLKDGVIADFDASEQMISMFIKNIPALKKKLFAPSLRMVICIPSGITEVERRAVKDSAIRAGARDVVLIEEPMAAAIGVGLPIDEPSANMIVDIGGGTTEVAIISLAGVVYTKSIRVGGDEIDTAIINYMKRSYNLMIGERTAEAIKMTIGSAFKLEEESSMEVRGRDSVAGLPKTITITSEEIREALSDTISAITDLVRNALERCPPELSADLVDRGFVLAGGGALISGLDQYLSDATGLPVIIAEDPLSAVANGTGMVLQDLALLLKDVAETGRG